MFYQKIIRPLLFQFDPEFTHDVSLRALSNPLFSKMIAPPKKDFHFLERELWGLKFRNPIGFASGLDKDAIALQAWDHLGFSFAEIGGITPFPQKGNPKPRLIRFPNEKGLINRMGFPNDGLEIIAARLARYKKEGRWPGIPVGINICKSTATPLTEAWQDYITCLRALRHYGDFFVVNVSSPNMPGLRELQQKVFLNSILSTLQKENREGGNAKPILVKISSDLTHEQIGEVLECLFENGISGIISSNTLLARPMVKTDEKGGLSGVPIREIATETIRFIHKETNGKLPIIGVGGIFTGDDVREKLDAGATLLQLYTGFIYRGPHIISKIAQEMKATSSYT